MRMRIYYEDENEDEDYDDDGYDDEQDEDCGDNEDEDFDWNPQGGKHVKPLPIPYVTFIGAKIPKTTATTTSTQENINESLTDHVIYITTVDIELLEGEIVGGSTVEFSPYGIRGGSGGLMPWQAPPEYPSEPICYADTAAEDQIKYLNHFTGIFGSFILETGNLVSIQGPVAARAMQATNISINTLTDDEEYCRQADDIARYGLIVDTLSYNGHVNGSVAFSSVDVLQLAQTPQDCEVFVGASNEISARVLGLFPDVFIQTSASLASYKATYQFNADNSVSSIWTADAYSKYMIFTFPPCSDQTCEASPTDTDSLSNAILKGGSSWTGPSDPYFYYENKPTLLNVCIILPHSKSILIIQ
ncbi:hypothetical protein G6F42_023284 [Rhizopus arrhizus]|nr:hypothetical protein G6F42_023284 [Rhizopus arrhizus]